MCVLIERWPLFSCGIMQNTGQIKMFFQEKCPGSTVV